MAGNENHTMNTKEFASSKSLSALASQLHSEDDRQHYANVINLAENLKRQIQLLHLANSPQSISNSIPLRLNLSPRVGFPHDTSHKYEGSQDLERYYRLLERSQSIRKTISRISTHFDDDSKTLLSAPLHPPPPFPPPPTPYFPPTSQSLSDVKPLKILPSIATTPTPKNQVDEPITPPATPNSSAVHVGFEYNGPPLPSPPPKPPLIRIVHVQKRINGFRGFLTRTYQLSSDIVMSHALTTHLRLFTATQMMTGEPKAILKLVLTARQGNRTDKSYLEPNCHGFSFYWPGGPTQPHMKPNRTYDMTQFSSAPDSHVQEALEQWIEQQAVLPPLHQATHILRENVKIYVVYNRFLFNRFSRTL